MYSNPTSGNPTFSLQKEIASPEVIHEIHDSKGCTFLSEELPDIDSFNDIRPYFDDDLFDSEGEKIKEAELLIDQLDLPCDILSEYDSFNSQDFSRDDVLPSPDNEDKDFDPLFYELLVFKEVPNSMRLLPFSSENEEKVFKPGIYTFKKPDEDFSCSKWKEYSSLGCSSVPFLSSLIRSSMGEIWLKKAQEKDKIGSKPDKKGKRGEAEKCQKQLQ
nr:hypothetical protein [Tanacetum cinerariifolium]